MPPTPHLRISPAQRSDQKRPSPAPARGFLCPQISPPPPMKRPGTPLLFILSNQPPPQQKNTAPPDETSPPPKLPHPSQHLLPNPGDFLFLFPTNRRPSPSGAVPPHPVPLPAPSNFPTLPNIYSPARLPPSFYSRPTVPYPAEKHRPTRWPPRAPKLSHPSHHLLPDPIGPLFLCPVQAPPPLSGKHRPTRWPPRTPKLPRPSHHLLPDPGDFLFLFPTNRRPPPGGKHHPSRHLFPTHPNSPTLPTTYCPTRLTPSFYSRPTPTSSFYISTRHPPSRKHRPTRWPPRAPNFPALPSIYCPTRVTPSFYVWPTATPS